MADLEDHELLRRAAAGDEQSFTALYRRRQSAVYRFALQMSGSAGIAEEVTQEVFMSLLDDKGSYDPGRGPLASYLYGIARRLVWRCLERDRPQLPLEEESGEAGIMPDQLIAQPDVERRMVRDQTAQSVRRAVLALPTAYREVVVLCDLHELGYADAAKVLGCAIGTVRSRLHRARALLAGKLSTKNSSGCLV
jgi:RNA polymerase sigma-70 factor, ECF subfamily